MYDALQKMAYNHNIKDKTKFSAKFIPIFDIENDWPILKCLCLLVPNTICRFLLDKC